MKKHLRLILVALLLTAVSGCFPIFVPVDDDHHGGRGRGGGYEHSDRDRERR